MCYYFVGHAEILTAYKYQRTGKHISVVPVATDYLFFIAMGWRFEEVQGKWRDSTHRYARLVQRRPKMHINRSPRPPKPAQMSTLEPKRSLLGALA